MWYFGHLSNTQHFGSRPMSTKMGDLASDPRLRAWLLFSTENWAGLTCRPKRDPLQRKIIRLQGNALQILMQNHPFHNPFQKSNI
jgi:hypothetical protein